MIDLTGRTDAANWELLQGLRQVSRARGVLGRKVPLATTVTGTPAKLNWNEVATSVRVIADAALDQITLGGDPGQEWYATLSVNVELIINANNGEVTITLFKNDVATSLKAKAVATENNSVVSLNLALIAKVLEGDIVDVRISGTSNCTFTEGVFMVVVEQGLPI